MGVWELAEPPKPGVGRPFCPASLRTQSRGCRTESANAHLSSSGGAGGATATRRRNVAANVIAASCTRRNNPSNGQVADRWNTIRRVLVRTTAPTFHSRVRHVLTSAVAISGTAAAVASRYNTPIA